MRTLACCLLLLWPAALFAQANAVITGPDRVQPGDLVVLDGSESLADDREWILVNSNKQFLAFENDQKLVFASGDPGEYTFILAVSLSDAGGSAVSVAQHVVTVGQPPKPPDPPGPGPDPEPEPEPEPPGPDLTDVGRGAKGAVEQSETTSIERQKIAASFRSIAAKAAGLASMTVEQIAAEASRAVRGSLVTPSDQQRWVPFRDWFAETMQRAVTDRASAIRLLDEVADGIDAAGGAGEVSGDRPQESLRGMLDSLKQSTEGLKDELNSIEREIGR